MVPRTEQSLNKQASWHLQKCAFGEGNGNPLQCPCLENPRDRGAWWAAVCGVAQSWTRLKQLSSGSSNLFRHGMGVVHHEAGSGSRDQTLFRDAGTRWVSTGGKQNHIPFPVSQLGTATCGSWGSWEGYWSQ